MARGQTPREWKGITSLLSLAAVTHSQSLLGTTPLAQSFAKGCKSLRDERFISVHYQTWVKAVNSEWLWSQGFYPCCEFCSWVLSFAVHTCWSNGPCQNPIQFIFDMILRPLAVRYLLSQHRWAPHSKLSPVLMVQRIQVFQCFPDEHFQILKPCFAKRHFFTEAKILLMHIFWIGECLRR